MSSCPPPSSLSTELAHWDKHPGEQAVATRYSPASRTGYTRMSFFRLTDDDDS